MNLAEQVAEHIKADLRSGELDPAGRLPGYRVLGQCYGVSDGTARKALEQLEAASVLQRRNRSGTYVSPLFLKDFEAVRLLTLVFPEKAISLEQLDYENYAISMEIFQGLMHEASNLNARVEFRYMPETDNRILLEQQVCQLKDSNGVVMIGRQLQPLRKQLKTAGISVQSIFSYQEIARNSKMKFGCSLTLTMDKICSYLHKAGYQRVVVITGSKPGEPCDHEEELKINAFRKHGLLVEVKFHGEIYESANLLKCRKKEQVFFSLDTESIPEIYRFAYQNGLQIGRDFDLFGLASGLSFANYFPPLSYFRLPYFELGCMAACSLLGKKRDFMLEATYIQGETTRKVKF